MFYVLGLAVSLQDGIPLHLPANRNTCSTRDAAGTEQTLSANKSKRDSVQFGQLNFTVSKVLCGGEKKKKKKRK
jgi:hypothetical protein